LFLLRRAPDADGPVVWDGRERICLTRGRELRLRPQQAETLRTTQSVREILGDSLPEGEYLVSAVFNVNRVTVMRSAGRVGLRR
jgi:hypothetical protein